MLLFDDIISSYSSNSKKIIRNVFFKLVFAICEHCVPKEKCVDFVTHEEFYFYHWLKNRKILLSQIVTYNGSTKKRYSAFYFNSICILQTFLYNTFVIKVMNYTQTKLSVLLLNLFQLTFQNDFELHSTI